MVRSPHTIRLSAAAHSHRNSYTVQARSASSHSAFENERLEKIDLRADDGLTASKDAQREAA